MTYLTPLLSPDFFGRLPTTDLYFRNPVQALRADLKGMHLPRTRFLAPNVYGIGRTAVVVRYGREADLDLLQKHGIRRIVYVADDDFAAGAEDPRLPRRYREKLAEFARREWPALTAAADVVVVPGAVLAAGYGDKARVIVPAWRHPPASADHFSSTRRIEMVHLGTGSHTGDLAALAPVLRKALDKKPAIRLTLFSGDATPAALRAHPRVRIRRPHPWWRYRLLLPGMRYHLALYPLNDSAFNRARSANKLYEHAVVGAASLMSPNPALRDAAGPSLEQIFVDGDAQEWALRLEDDLSDTERLRSRVEATRARIVSDDPLRRSVHAWRDILSPEMQ